MSGIERHLDGYARHLSVLQALSPQSVAAYRYYVEAFFAWLSAERPVAGAGEITQRDIEAYLEYCYYQGNQNSTRATKLTALSKFFRYLLYEGKIERDITAMIPKPKIRKRFIPKFKKEEILRFFRAIDIETEKGRRDVCIFILLAFCGLRRSEITGLRLADITDEDGTSVDVNVIDTKFQSYRTVYLWKAPTLFIRQLITIRVAQGTRPEDPLFIGYRKGGSTSGQPLSPIDIDRLVKSYAKKADIAKPRISPHMFRATHASDLRMIQGYDIAAIAERLGHRHISTTDGYLPARGRIHRTYQSLSAYWSEFPRLWDRREEEVK